jgi:hypothetical protein
MSAAKPEDKYVTERTFSETLETPVSFVSNTEVELRLVLLMFARHCDVPICCNEKASAKLETSVKISVEKPIPFKEFIEYILKQQGLIYTVVDNTVYITSAVSNETTQTTEKIEQSGHAEQQTTSPISEQLKKPVSCNIKEPVTLTDALKQINEITGISVMIDHDELRKSHAMSETETEIKKTFHFYLPFKLPLRNVLDYLTKQQNLAWTVSDNYILITSKKHAEREEKESYVRCYYVADLLKDVPKLLNEKEPSAVPLTAVSEASYKPLIDYITVMIEAETWNDNIQIYYPNKSLVIRQPKNVHKQIAELLKTLRQFNHISGDVTKNFLPELSQTLPASVYYYQQYNLRDLAILTQDDVNELVDLIQAVTPAKQWKKHGGQGIITVLENQYISVFQEHRIHVAITDLLQQLRQLKAINCFLF